MKKSNDGKAHGINVHIAMEWLLNIVFLRKQVTTPQPQVEVVDPGHFGGGSPNMKLLYSLLWYAWAWLTDSRNMSVHRERMRRIINRERSFYGNVEPTTSSHGQLWLAVMTGALYVALQCEHDDVRDEAVWWLRIDHAIHWVTEADGAMWAPGGRCTDKPKNMGGKLLGSNPTRPKYLQALQTGKTKGKANQYDIGAWFMTRVPQAWREEIQRWPQSFPPMAGGFHARRYANGDFIAWYEDLEGVADTTYATGRFEGALWISESPIDDDDKNHHINLLDAHEGETPELSIDAPAAVTA